MSDYLSDREGPQQPRHALLISGEVWGGFVALLRSLIDAGAFGADYPEMCPDGRGPVGTDVRSMGLALRAEISAVEWPLQVDNLPPTPSILDLLEFAYRVVAAPIQVSYHQFFDHYHLGFDRVRGRQDFRERVNRILSRNRLAYELVESGRIERIIAPTLAEALASMRFTTGDAELDALLEAARAKFLSPDPTMRRESIEKLWDAWERLKSIEGAADKKASTKALLDKAADEPTLRQVLENEAIALTKIGNTFRIRHAEMSQVAVTRGDQIDYLFHRLFALVWLLLRAR